MAHRRLLPSKSLFPYVASKRTLGDNHPGRHQTSLCFANNLVLRKCACWLTVSSWGGPYADLPRAILFLFSQISLSAALNKLAVNGSWCIPRGFHNTLSSWACLKHWEQLEPTSDESGDGTNQGARSWGSSTSSGFMRSQHYMLEVIASFFLFKPKKTGQSPTVG